MEIKYFNKITKELTTVNVNSKVAHFIESEKQKNKKLPPEQVSKLKKKQKEEYYQIQFENEQYSLDELMEAGFQPSSPFDFDKEIEKKEREKKYLNSLDYKRFRKSLRFEIKKTFDIMPAMIKKAMFLRFFKDLSINEIAKELKISKGATQTLIGRGCEYIKFFLDEDIAEQDKKEKERKMKIAQQRIVNRKTRKK